MNAFIVLGIQLTKSKLSNDVQRMIRRRWKKQQGFSHPIDQLSYRLSMPPLFETHSLKDGFQTEIMLSFTLRASPGRREVNMLSTLLNSSQFRWARKFHSMSI